MNGYVFTGQCYPFEVIFIYNGNDPEQSALILAHRQGNKPDIFFIHDSQRENEMNPERKEFNHHSTLREKENTMKKSIVMSALFCLITVSSALAGSSVDSSISNSTSGQELTNMAVGTQSEANLGVVSLKDAKVGGTISNYTNGRNFTNMSLGVQSEANLGVVKVENAKVSPV